MTHAATPIRSKPAGGAIHRARRVAEPTRYAIRSTREGGRAGDAVVPAATRSGKIALCVSSWRFRPRLMHDSIGQSRARRHAFAPVRAYARDGGDGCLQR